MVDYGEVEQALALPREESLSQLGSAELARLLGSSGFSRTGSGGSPFQAALPADRSRLTAASTSLRPPGVVLIRRSAHGCCIFPVDLDSCFGCTSDWITVIPVT